MDSFEFKTNGNLSPHGRQKVFFAGHPDDFKLYFNEISQLFLKKFDCAIWYSHDETADEEFLLKLNEMQLIVIPITKKFLSDPSRTRDFDVPYALEQHIPILPLMEESGLTEKYTEVFGDLHYLDKTACDITTLSYEEKVQKFLSFILLDNDEINKVREAFYACIFLSYRKTDRAYANEIMKAIHHIPFCRDIAIWYDEYLIPGKDFNDAILEKIKKSNLFVLCVTDNVLDENNYIQKKEYPEARKNSVPVLPIISEETKEENIGKLKNLYEDIPQGISYVDKTAFEERLRANFLELATSDADNNPAHLFLIGLAYLKGIEVEVNYERGLNLLEKSAQSDFLPAIKKLTYMYQYGEYVDRNLEKALELFDKQICILSAEEEKEELFALHRDVMGLLLEAGEVFRAFHGDHIKKYTMACAKLLSETKISKLELFNIFSLMAFVNTPDQICKIFIKNALELINDEDYHNEDFSSAIGVFYSKLAKLYYKGSAGTLVYNIISDSFFSKGRYLSKNYITHAVEILDELYEKNPVKWSHGYADVLTVFCEMNYSQPFCSIDELVNNTEKALRILGELYEDEKVTFAERIASLSLCFAEYLAIEMDFLWEDELDIVLDLSLEEIIGESPEQKLLLELKIFDGYGNQYDIRRIRKTLSLMRYSVSLYRKTAVQKEFHCLIELVYAYFCLARMLYCLSGWLSAEEDNEIKNIRREVLLDGYLNYKLMLETLSSFPKNQTVNLSDMGENEIVTRVPHVIYSIDDEEQDSSEPPKIDIDALLELEKAIYSKNLFSECYNYAVELSENGFNEEAMDLHTNLYFYFKETNYK